jgi:acetyl-CoA carboxylase biotin carboxyl carrier protein
MYNSNNNDRSPQVVGAVPDRVIEVTAESREPSVNKPVSTNRDNFLEIKSPMVGTFYRSPAPDANPFVEPGEKILRGQTVCIIEAMKLMNEIESDYEGKIVEVLVQNAQPVQFGQPLFVIEPA